MARLVPLNFMRTLREAILASERQMDGHRAARARALREFAGHHHGFGDYAHANPLNMLQIATTAHVATLAARKPRYRVRAHRPDFKIGATNLQVEFDYYMREIKAQKLFRQWTHDSMFSYAIAKTGVTDTHEVARGGQRNAVGSLFTARVDQDDHVLDPVCRDRDEAMWEGNRFRIGLDFVKDSERFQNTDRLDAHVLLRVQTEDQWGGESKLTLPELVPMIELYDIYIPDEGVTITMSVQDGDEDEDALAVAESALADYGGPYDVLGYRFIPNEPLPLPPVSAWIDLNTMVNSLMRKVKQQADNAKTILGYEAVAVDDAERMMDAAHGDAIQINNIEKMKEFTFNGPDPQMIQAISAFVQMFSRQSGNSDLMSGMRTKAGSATEAAFMQANSNNSLNDMRGEVESFAESIGTKLAYLYHTDPLMERWVVHKLRGTRHAVSRLITPEDRVGRFLDYAFEIVPHSMGPRDPKTHIENLMRWYTQVVLPTLQFSAMQGSPPDITQLVRTMAAEMQLDEVDEIYQPGPTSAMEGPALGLDMIGMGSGNSSAGDTADQQALAQLSQQIGQRLPGENPNQTPPNMSREGQAALAGG